MKSLFAMTLALVATMPAPASAQPEKGALMRVHVITCTGTLPRNPKNRLEYLRYATTGEPRLTGQGVDRAHPGGAAVRAHERRVRQFLNCDTREHLKELGTIVDGRLKDPDIAGVVVTHGTNTIEETAYFLNLTMKHDKPVVIVGAQRPFSTMSSDAAVNLLNAIRVAADPAARGKGTLVVTNDEINAARDVTKSNTYRVQTFSSRELGILGYADPDRIVFYRAPLRKHTTQSQFELGKITAFPKVNIVYSHSGDDGDIAKAAVAAGAKGLVIAGTGAGHTGNARKTLKALFDETGVVVVRSNRTGSGRVIRDDNWQEPGFVAADNLSPQKARILLQLGLTTTAKPDDIQRMFDEY